MQEFLSKHVIGVNTVENFLWFFGILLFGMILQMLFTKPLAQLIFSFLKKHSSGVPFDKLFQLVKGPLGRFILFVSLYFACDQLTIPAEWKMTPPQWFGWRMIANRILYVAIALSFTQILLRVVDFFGVIMLHRASLTDSKTDDQLVPFLREAIKVVIVILSLFFIMGAIFHLNVASLIAGLGIGGLAVALAAKESIENLIGSFTIFLDKPFIVGDHIKVGNIEGIVEKIGFRSSRVRTLEKSLVTVPNKNMVSNDLDNLTKRTHRRVRNTIGLAFGSGKEQVKNIVTDLASFFEYHEHIFTQESSARFSDIGNSSINIVIDYYIIGNEPELYFTVREEVNYKIIELVHKHGCSFAYPTQTIFVNDPKRV